ncbi:phosphatidylserine decarboxylase 1 [Prunus dulcis]|uniref:Phosphatidylserine decarboxylase 1 n=1 Tax=Prunus dulcis TaxID=3755 RepID=A0A4Y1RHH1_PRUDU|nr:phosphatidylserine decarboxylase 1 [Prunus dulcis]
MVFQLWEYIERNLDVHRAPPQSTKLALSWRLENEYEIRDYHIARGYFEYKFYGRQLLIDKRS